MKVKVRGKIEIKRKVEKKNEEIEGIGLWMLNDLIEEDEIEKGKMIKWMEELIVRDGGIYEVYKNRRYMKEKIREIVDFMKKWLKERE